MGKKGIGLNINPLIVAFLVVIVLAIALMLIPVLPTIGLAIVPTRVVTAFAPTQAVTALPTLSPTVEFANVCQNAKTCNAPIATDTAPSDTYCVEKYPYQNISVPPSTIFEVLDNSGSYFCKDSGEIVNGMMVVTCTGPELIAFDLKLTNPACGAINLLEDTSQCQEGYGFDPTRQCCSPISTSLEASVTIKVNMGACPEHRP